MLATANGRNGHVNRVNHVFATSNPWIYGTKAQVEVVSRRDDIDERWADAGRQLVKKLWGWSLAKKLTGEELAEAFLVITEVESHFGGAELMRMSYTDVMEVYRELIDVDDEDPT